MSNRRYNTPINTKTGTVDMTHGSGGRSMAQLIEGLFFKYLDNELLRQANDQAAFNVPAGRMVMSTDGHVISPLFFPGGDIGSLSVHGTVNDVAMSGAKPLYLAAGFILEEGFPLADLDRIVASMGLRPTERAYPLSPATPRWLRRARVTVSLSPPPVLVWCLKALKFPVIWPVRVMQFWSAAAR